MTVDRVCPAAYIRAVRGDDEDLARQRAAVAAGSRQRGWPPPAVYTEDDPDLADGPGPALARLAAAVEAGRHDALLITDPGAVTGAATYLIGLLHRCARNGVVVGFLVPPAPGASPATATAPAGQGEAAGPLAVSDWGVLAHARVEALSGLFPDWRIWLDERGWHARRRQTPYMQVSSEGAPAYSVHAGSPTDLAAQLCWQQAADRHAPGGCAAR